MSKRDIIEIEIDGAIQSFRVIWEIEVEFNCGEDYEFDLSQPSSSGQIELEETSPE